MGDLAHKCRRHRGDTCKQDAEDGAGCLDVGIGAMCRQRRAESPYKIEQAMRFHAGKRDSRKIERIDPGILQQGITAGMTRGERTIELCVMRDHLRIANEFHKLGQCVGGKRSIGHIAIVDIGQVRDIFRNGLSRVHERDEPFDYFALFHASCSDLRQLIMVEREAGGLGVQNHDVMVEIAEIHRRCDFGKRRIPVADGLGSAIAYETLQGILREHILFIHTVQPIIYHGIIQTVTPTLTKRTAQRREHAG